MQSSRKAAEAVEGDVSTGVKIVLRALEEPVRQIANNAGLEGSIIVDRLKREEVGIGFNANWRMGKHDGSRRSRPSKSNSLSFTKRDQLRPYS